MLDIDTQRKSWVDWMIERMQRSRIPAWLVLVFVCLVLYLGISASQWAGGAYAQGTFNLFHAFFVFELAYLPLLMLYLNRSAEAAFREYQPVLKGSEDERTGLKGKLLHSTPLLARPSS
jgi:hypothetical protein